MYITLGLLVHVHYIGHMYMYIGLVSTCTLHWYMYYSIIFPVLPYQAESMFARLHKSCVQFQDWVVLGSVDLEDLVDRHCSVVSDWEKHFRALKGRGRDAERLPKLAGNTGLHFIADC